MYVQYCVYIKCGSKQHRVLLWYIFAGLHPCLQVMHAILDLWLYNLNIVVSVCFMIINQKINCCIYKITKINNKIIPNLMKFFQFLYCMIIIFLKIRLP